MPSVSRYTYLWERKFCTNCGAVALRLVDDPDGPLRSPKNPDYEHMCRKIDFRRRLEELPLTEQEEAIIQNISNGRTDKETGRAVKLSEQRVAARVRIICTKMGAKNRSEAVANYVRATEVDPLADAAGDLIECIPGRGVNPMILNRVVTEVEKVNVRRSQSTLARYGDSNGDDPAHYLAASENHNGR